MPLGFALISGENPDFENASKSCQKVFWTHTGIGRSLIALEIPMYSCALDTWIRGTTCSRSGPPRPLEAIKLGSRPVLAASLEEVFGKREATMAANGREDRQADIVRRYAGRVGYSASEIERFREGGHRIRQVERLSRAAPNLSIVAEVVEARHCNSGHTVGQSFTLDVDGNFITRHCPKKMCVYLVSQLAIPVALINERLSEGLDPNDFHFMRYVRCPDVGVECHGYGEVMLKVAVRPRSG